MSDSCLLVQRRGRAVTESDSTSPFVTQELGTRVPLGRSETHCVDSLRFSATGGTSYCSKADRRGILQRRESFATHTVFVLIPLRKGQCKMGKPSRPTSVKAEWANIVAS